MPRIRPVLVFALLALGLGAAAAPRSGQTDVAAEKGQSSSKGTVLVTGANRGIGLALVCQCKADGYDVIGTARNPTEAAELRETGATVLPLDVGDATSVAALAEALKGKPIDILINNAGVTSRGESIAEVDFDAVARAMATNTIGPMRVTQALLPNLRAGQRKTVVGISSGLGSIANNTSGRYYGYRESKAALNMFTRSLAAELKPEGFICIVMSPGWVRTDMGGSQAPLSPEDSVKGIMRVVEGLKAEDTGSFFSHEGKTLPW